MKTIGLIMLLGLLALAGCGQQQETTPPAETSQEEMAEEPATTPDTMQMAQGIPAVEGDTVTTESGLKYIDITVGEGDSPESGQTVVAHYTGWLTDGTKFDSSRDRGEPIQFPIGQRRVIPGWDEGLMSMKVGGRRMLIIPPELAYGQAGRPGAIPPNSTLIFDVELVDVMVPATP